MLLHWFSALLLVAAFAGLSESRAAASPPSSKTAARKAVLPDAAIEAAVRKKFAASKIAVNGFTVQVRNGVAIIQGRTAVVQHKGTATRLAKTAGARAVDNRVTVDKAARDKAAAPLREARRRAKVVRSQPR
jgi:hypothetical protein